MFLSLLVGSTWLQSADDCLLFVTHNLAKGDGNWFTYYKFSNKSVKIRKGDKLSYEIFLDPRNPVAKGSIDVDFSEGEPLRDRGLTDSGNRRAHGDGDLMDASGKWLKRSIDLDDMVGTSTTQWSITSEGDPDGRYVIAVDSVKVVHADGTVDVIYETGKPESGEQVNTSGYTKFPALIVTERSKVQDGADIEPTIAVAEKIAKNKRKLEALESELDLIEKFLKDKPIDQHTKTHILEARVLLNSLYKLDEITAEEIEAAMHVINEAADHAHPEMKKFTGHLVGHAHIDLQWLWEWQEGIVASHDTFNQAVKFMDEFPGFTFSQSSSVIYQTVEQNYPDLFKKVQAKVKSGKWELVGGRVCEGDTNMISPESHVRQFLYGQKYFREKFGKTATVGWEPDTFGHTAQMPQILKLGGCKYYYFCRGGKNKPLFWWEALDGSKILTFEEPATNSWYNGDVGYKQFQEMLDFEKNNGSKDMLWVYGVGNHGGGPTREMINEALKLQTTKNLPEVKFSTATQFFKKLETYDLTKIPNIKSELNPVFDGCYTTHSEVKQLNRQAENALATAETVSAMANQFGFDYPAAQFRTSWEDVCFNHHHDTLPGSGIHPTYEKSKITLGRAIYSSHDTTQRAMETLSLRLTPAKGGMSFVVANPLGWKRSEWVETYAVPSGWDSQSMRLEDLVAVAPDGTQTPVEVIDNISKKVRFLATDVPSFGYKVFQLKNGRPVDAEKLVVTGNTISGSNLRAIVDAESGGFSELTIGDNHYTNVGRLENHYERPGGMSAWVIAPIDSVKVWKPSKMSIVQGAHEVKVVFEYSIPSLNRPSETTSAKQTFTLRPDRDFVNSVVDCDWHHVGSARQPNPMLRVSFGSSGELPRNVYDVPFGFVERLADGRETVALKWGTLGNLAVINDSKYGYSAKATTLFMTLIRSSYEPDPEPNPGKHTWKYAIKPTPANDNFAELSKFGYQFNQPMQVATVPFDAKGSAPLEWSLSGIDSADTLMFGAKLAEGSKDLIVRMYQCSGAEAALKPSFAVAGTPVEVNFIEDTLNPFTGKIRGFEIKSLRVTRKK